MTVTRNPFGRRNVERRRTAELRSRFEGQTPSYERPSTTHLRRRFEGPAGSNEPLSETELRRRMEGRSDRESQRIPTSIIIQAGNFGSELSRMIDKMQDSELIGRIPSRQTKPELFESLKVISKFLNEHKLAEAASRNRARRNGAGREGSCISTAPYYLPTLEKFAESQMDRQAAGLRTNADRESAEGLTQLVETHAMALDAALAENQGSFFSSEKLSHLHSILCPSLEEAGTFRTTEARAGRTIFCHSGSIHRQLELLWESLEILKSDWFSRNRDTEREEDISKIYYAFAFAATALYAINDIHPFADGNGRTSRIYVNAILKRLLKLPFTITIAGTAQHRKEYLSGLQRGRSTLEMLNEERDLPPRQPAVMEPLIKVLIDRVTHAIVQVQSLLTEEARLASTVSREDEQRIGRRIRERAANGQCIICLDTNPNIATLCCGQAVHLNCMAEWLANGSNCVFCRTALPRLQLSSQCRECPTTSNSAACNRGGQRRSTNGRGDSGERQRGGRRQRNSETRNCQSSRESPRSHGRQCHQCNAPATADCTNGLCGRCCLFRGHNYCERHGNLGNQDDEFATETTEHYPVDTTATAEYREEPECLGCRGRNASRECINGMCRQCCTSSGNYECFLHSARNSSGRY